MSKKHKNVYQTEYSLSFNWENDDNRKPTNNITYRRSETINPSSNVTDKRVNHFRHKLKLALLEKLEKLESKYMMNKSQQFHHDSVVSMSKSRKKPVFTKESHLQSPTEFSKTKIPEKKVQKLKSDKLNEWQQELRRSRSLALEFKHKNESTQIWWLTESADESSEDDDYLDGHVQIRSITKDKLSMNIPPPVKPTTRNKKPIPKGFDVNSNKMQRLEMTPSTLSRSSFSYQMAQATGYQSTTDELSSFNPDTDAVSTDPTGYKPNILHSGFTDKVPSNSKNADLKLDLSMNNSKTSSSLNQHILFHVPYQTEDFIKDSSSDSNMQSVNNSDTYRLD